MTLLYIFHFKSETFDRYIQYTRFYHQNIVTVILCKLDSVRMISTSPGGFSQAAVAVTTPAECDNTADSSHSRSSSGVAGTRDCQKCHRQRHSHLRDRNTDCSLLVMQDLLYVDSERLHGQHCDTPMCIRYTNHQGDPSSDSYFSLVQ